MIQLLHIHGAEGNEDFSVIHLIHYLRISLFFLIELFLLEHISAKIIVNVALTHLTGRVVTCKIFNNKNLLFNLCLIFCNNFQARKSNKEKCGTNKGLPLCRIPCWTTVSMNHSKWPVCNPCSNQIFLPKHKSQGIRLQIQNHFKAKFRDDEWMMAHAMENVHLRYGMVACVFPEAPSIVIIWFSYKLIHSKCSKFTGCFKRSLRMWILIIASSSLAFFTKDTRMCSLLRAAIVLLSMFTVCSSVSNLNGKNHAFLFDLHGLELLTLTHFDRCVPWGNRYRSDFFRANISVDHSY